MAWRGAHVDDLGSDEEADPVGRGHEAEGAGEDDDHAHLHRVDAHRVAEGLDDGRGT